MVDVDGKVDVNDKLDVNDKVEENDMLDVNDKVDVNGKLDVNDKLHVNDKLDVNDILDINDNLDVNEKLEKSDIEVSDAFNGYFQPEIVKDFNYIKPLIINEEEVIEEVSTFDYPAYEIGVYEDNYPDYIIYEDIEPIETKEAVIMPPNLHISIPDNNIDQEALDPNQILPRVAVECFRFDCLSQPQHECCNPHKTKKRQTRPGTAPKQEVMEHILEDHPGRVTATVTRVQKTVRW